MSINLTLPFGEKTNVKDIIFSILTKEYPLRIVELTNYIRKRYGKSISFQAVRKALIQLKEEGIIIQKDNSYLINKDWVIKTKNLLDEIYSNLNLEKSSPKSIESIKGEVSIFSFNSLNEAMVFWEQIIEDWYKSFKKGDSKINCYQAAHAWEALVHPDKERKIMEALKNKGIKSYILTTGNSPLDKYLKKFYSEIGIKITIDNSTSDFDKSYYVGTYGETVVQTHYPKELVKELETFFRKNRSLENLNLGDLSKIVSKKIEIKLTVIKDEHLAKQINKSIIGQLN